MNVQDIETEIEELATDELLKDKNPPQLIHLNNIYDYKHLKEVLKERFRKFEEVSFAINNSINLNGKVINNVQEYKQKVNLCYAVRGEVKEVIVYGLYFFDEKIPKDFKTFKKFEDEFYMQRFLSGDKEYLLLSKDKLDMVEYTIKGLVVEITDYKDVGITAKLSTTLPIIFINSYTPRIIKYNSHQEFFDKIKELNLTENKLMNFIFSSREKQFKGKSLRHPKYFEWMITSFLFGGEFDGYPNHLMILARQGTGKTRLEECLFRKMKEIQAIVEGSGSTIKALIPSFKSSTPDVGALITSNRLCIIDEFLRILTRMKPEEREHQLAMLNPLLEHTKRLFKSGNSQVYGNMTAKMLTVSNAVYGTKTMVDLTERIDNAFLSRLLIYYQSEDHIKWIEQKKGLEKTEFEIEEDLWLSIYDYLNSFNCELDENNLKEFFDGFTNILPNQVKDIYTSRYFHHLLCLADGVIKTRSLIENDLNFKMIDKDLDIIKVVWRTIISNWKINESMKSIPKEDRIRYLTEKEKYVFDIIKEQRSKIYYSKLPELIKDIQEEELDIIIFYLRELELIQYINHYYYTYEMVEEFDFTENS